MEGHGPREKVPGHNRKTCFCTGTPAGQDSGRGAPITRWPWVQGKYLAASSEGIVPTILLLRTTLEDHHFNKICSEMFDLRFVVLAIESSSGRYKSEVDVLIGMTSILLLP